MENIGDSDNRIFVEKENQQFSISELGFLSMEFTGIRDSNNRFGNKLHHWKLTKLFPTYNIS